MDGLNTNIINRITAAIRTLNTRLDAMDTMIGEIRGNLNTALDELNKLKEDESNEITITEDTTSPFSIDYLGNFVGSFNGNISGTFNGEANINRMNASYYSTEMTGNIMIPANITVFEIKGDGDIATVISFPRFVKKGEVILVKNNSGQLVNIVVQNGVSEVLNSGGWKIYIYNGVKWC